MLCTVRRWSTRFYNYNLYLKCSLMPIILYTWFRVIYIKHRIYETLFCISYRTEQCPICLKWKHQTDVRKTNRNSFTYCPSTFNQSQHKYKQHVNSKNHTNKISNTQEIKNNPQGKHTKITFIKSGAYRAVVLHRPSAGL